MIRTNTGSDSVVWFGHTKASKEAPTCSCWASHTLLDHRLSPSTIPYLHPASRCLTTTELSISPLFGIYKQAPLRLHASCTKQRKPFRARFARWGSCTWEGKELYHTTDLLVNWYIYSYEITQKLKVIAFRSREENSNLQKKRLSNSSRKKIGDKTYSSTCRWC